MLSCRINVRMRSTVFKHDKNYLVFSRDINAILAERLGHADSGSPNTPQ